MILQIQFIPKTIIAKSIAIAWYAILNKVSRDTDSDITLKKYCNTDSDITLKKYCNTDSDTEKSIGDTSNSDIVLQY